MSLPKGSQRDIFVKEGRQAHAKGFNCSDCPYKHTKARNAWIEGWCACEEQRLADIRIVLGDEVPTNKGKNGHPAR